MPIKIISSYFEKIKKNIIVIMRKNNFTQIAICYDFDGTLCKGNMQEYGFMSTLGMTPDEFWAKCAKHTKQYDMDKNLSYMKCMLDEAKMRHKVFRKEDFIECGKTVDLFNGVVDWFDRINDYGRKKGVIISHYLISSGLEEIVQGTPIYKKFAKVFAGSYIYNGYGEAIWPARVVSSTEKTQYLFRINKDRLEYSDNVNEAMSDEERKIPFNHMIYFGDGETDVPCMSMLGNLGGYSVGVYQPHKSSSKKQAEKLFAEGRVNLVAPADYSAGKTIDRYVKRVIDKIHTDEQLDCFK